MHFSARFFSSVLPILARVVRGPLGEIFLRGGEYSPVSVPPISAGASPYAPERVISNCVPFLLGVCAAKLGGRSQAKETAKISTKPEEREKTQRRRRCVPPVFLIAGVCSAQTSGEGYRCCCLLLLREACLISLLREERPRLFFCQRHHEWLRK